MGGALVKESDKHNQFKHIKFKDDNIVHMTSTPNFHNIFFVDKYFANVTVKLDNSISILETREYKYDQVLLPEPLQKEIIYTKLSKLPSAYVTYFVTFLNGNFTYKIYDPMQNMNTMDTADIYLYEYVKIGTNFYKRKFVSKNLFIKSNLNSYENITTNHNLIQTTLNNNLLSSKLDLNTRCGKKMYVKSKWYNTILNLLKGNNLHLVTILLSPRVLIHKNSLIDNYIKYSIKDITLDEKLLHEQSLTKEELDRDILDKDFKCDIDYDNNSIEKSQSLANNDNIFPVATACVNIVSLDINAVMDDNETDHDIPEAIMIDEM